jgi:asparagine synthase (glutamine-hydrolysing)
MLRPLHRALANHLAITGAELVLDGTGGDNVFCYLASATPALDASRSGAWSEGVAALGNLARVHDTTAWAVARAAWRRSRRPRIAWQREQSFLAPGASARAAHHPWLDAPDEALRGAYEQVQSIVGIRHFIVDAAPGAPAFLHPLLSQPVLEACLRIPSWLWVRGGRDRAVARAAFRGLLPNSILARRSKGRLESMFVAGYMARRAELENLLLEGRLAQAGLLDRDAIGAYLHREEQPQDPGYIRLLDIASAETWLRSFDA